MIDIIGKSSPGNITTSGEIEFPREENEIPREVWENETLGVARARLAFRVDVTLWPRREWGGRETGRQGDILESGTLQELPIQGRSPGAGALAPAHGAILKSPRKPRSRPASEFHSYLPCIKKQNPGAARVQGC